MDLGLSGKRAFITGASRGLGYAVAKLLSAEGARVAINARDPERLVAAARGIGALALAGDLAEAGKAADLVEAAARELGGLDILVCNAGGPPPGAFDSFDDAAWAKAVDLCLMSHVRLIRAALPHLRASRCASVLTVTSLSVKQPIANLVLSNSVRAATIGLTKSLALELGKEGIRFNSILPSWTETERLGELLSARAKAKGTSVDFERAEQAKESPLGRVAASEEFAAAAVFLVSPVASYITGTMLAVDGGMYKGIF